MRTGSDRGDRLGLGLAAALLAGLLAPGAAASAAPAAASAAPSPATAPVRAAQDGDDEELAQLLAAERREADRLRRRGRPRGALGILQDHLDEDPDDAAALALRARARYDLGETEGALADAERARELAGAGGDDEAVADAARQLAFLEVELGRAAAGVAALEAAGPAFRPAERGGDAWLLGHALLESGAREHAFDAFELGSRTPAVQDWRDLLGKGRCLRARQRYELASRVLVAADQTAQAGEGVEPEVLVELGELYFEVDGEVADAQTMPRKPAELFREALDLAPGDEGALLGLYELHRFNWNRQSRSEESYLEELFAQNPSSVRGLLAGLAGDLDNGRLKRGRERLARLEELAPGRRDVRAEAASLAWIEHRRDDAEATLAALAAEDPADGRPAREVGRHLVELYRFAEALPFLRRATERNPGDFDAWVALGQALANTGAEPEAREALAKAEEVSAGRQNAWRHNMAKVLDSMARLMVEKTFGDLTFVWRPEGAGVFETYLVPFYREARADLSRRYGYTAVPVRIEVFRKHEEFSVRSIGFPGFPALGVCFGPVVTSLSPLSELRGSYSWARTAYHEFTHVVHLGLSHNRCPRWVTEGLATWEEIERNPAWSRNMRRELLDARANGEIVPVRELNAIFRSSRIIFGYYQGGLLCDLLIRENGFPPIVRVLEAFDRGLDLDQTLEEVYGLTPEELDVRFLAYVDEFLEGLAIEPRWTEEVIRRKRLGLQRTAPAEAADRAAWREDWTTVAWGQWQHGRKIDAQEALRLLDEAGDLPPRATLLRAEIAFAQGDVERACEHWKSALAAGGEDYRARMALGRVAEAGGDREEAERQFLAAEQAFPGFDEHAYSAELSLAALYEAEDREDDAMRARERWLAWNADDFPTRMQVARWHADAGRYAEAVVQFAGANEIDPFSSLLHYEWGRSLKQLARYEEALRELTMAGAIPPALDRDADHLTDELRERIQELADACRAELDGAD